jgi:acyl-CoA oxidase
VYEAYYQRVKESNPFNPVHPYFDRIIKPLIERENLELGDDADEMELDEEIKEFLAEREEGGDGKEEEARLTEKVDEELKKPAK